MFLQCFWKYADVVCNQLNVQGIHMESNVLFLDFDTNASLKY